MPSFKCSPALAEVAFMIVTRVCLGSVGSGICGSLSELHPTILLGCSVLRGANLSALYDWPLGGRKEDVKRQ